MIQGDNLRIHAQRELMWNGVSLHLYSREGHKLAAAKPVVLEVIEHGAVATPMLTLPMPTAQQLMDELWNCGLRPTEGTGSAGSLAATERHLADMRKLAFHSLKVAP
jgi:hypothetical protein